MIPSHTDVALLMFLPAKNGERTSNVRYYFTYFEYDMRHLVSAAGANHTEDRSTRTPQRASLVYVYRAPIV